MSRVVYRSVNGSLEISLEDGVTVARPRSLFGFLSCIWRKA